MSSFHPQYLRLIEPITSSQTLSGCYILYRYLPTHLVGGDVMEEKGKTNKPRFTRVFLESSKFFG